MENWFIVLVSFSICSLLTSIFTLLRTSSKLPPGPPSIPILTNFQWLRKSTLQIESLLRSFVAKYGPIITLPIGTRPVIFIADPSIAHKALVLNGALFADRPPALPVAKIITSNQHNINSASYGPLWRLLRRNLTSQILHPSRLKSYSEARKWVLDVLINRFVSQSESGNPVCVIEHFQHAMFCLLVLMCFGDKLEESLIKEIEDVHRVLLLNFQRFSNLDLLPKLSKIFFRKRWEAFLEIRRKQDKVVIPLIESRRTAIQNRASSAKNEDKEGFVFSYVDTLLDLKLPEEDNRKLTDEEMVTLCSEFLSGANVAGFVTTATLSDRFISFERNNLATWPSSGIYISSHGLSTQAGAENSGEEDNVEDGFSELDEALPTTRSEIADDDDDIVDDGSQNELDLLEGETVLAEKKSSKWVPSELTKVIWNAPGLSVASALDKWVSEGNELSRSDISLTMMSLRRRRMFGKALQFSEWLEASGQLEFNEKDYASRLDLIAKVQGLHKAESYIAKIPKSFHGEVVHRTLLANYVVANNVKKAEEVFNKMKDLKFPMTTFAYDQMLILYKRIDKKKIADVLLLMEKENVKPSRFTYIVLIDVKGLSNDIRGMEQVVDTMKAGGMEPDSYTLSILAKHYVSGGYKDKAKAILKEIEESNSRIPQWSRRILLPLYGALQMEDEVRRLWKSCEENPRIEECMAAIVAWGRLKNVPEAERIFNIVVKTFTKLSTRHYYTMLKVYGDSKMLTKGKELVNQMAKSGCRIDPFTWDAVVKLYVEAGEVEKADSFLVKAAQQYGMKPLFTSYMTLMDHYARKGDVHNAEKIFHKMRQSGYMPRLGQFGTLIRAYVNAKTPAYGMRERMMGDKLFPNKALAGQLAQVDPFRKTAVSDLLD